MSKITVTRTSVLANKFGSYCYTVTPESVAGYAGVYLSADKTATLIFSPNNIGELNKATSVDFVERMVDGKKYINLVDPTAELAGRLGAATSLAAKAGFGAAGQTAAANIFFAQFAPKASATEVPATPVPDGAKM